MGKPKETSKKQVVKNAVVLPFFEKLKWYVSIELYHYCSRPKIDKLSQTRLFNEALNEIANGDALNECILSINALSAHLEALLRADAMPGPRISLLFVCLGDVSPHELVSHLLAPLSLLKIPVVTLPKDASRILAESIHGKDKKRYNNLRLVTVLGLCNQSSAARILVQASADQLLVEQMADNFNYYPTCVRPYK